MALSNFANGGVCLFLSNSYNKSMLYNGKLKAFRKTYQQVSWLSKSMYNVCVKREASTHTFKSFDSILQSRRNEAARTIVVQIESSKLVPKLIDYCSKYGNLKNVHYYVTSQKGHHALLEFESQKSIDKLLESACFIDEEKVIPTYSRFLWFKNNVISDSKIIIGNRNNAINIVNRNPIYTSAHINQKLATIDSISNQMLALCEMLELSDTETRLRFITANQIETSLSGLFPNLKILPFGSSINSFGKQGSDLDLVMCFTSPTTVEKETRFVHHTKSLSDDKQKIKLCLEIVAEQMKHLMPGILNVRKIFHARVPIIKYTHCFTELECDLSMTNMTAVYMSELLYLFGVIDSRVRPLVLTIKNWAYFVKLTNRNPGPWISNFSLTLLVLFFLQEKRIIPTLNTLQALAGKEDVRETDDQIDCTFLRDIRKLPRRKENTESLEDLLKYFFYFYSTFDFTNQAISIREGKTVVKPDLSAMYICNPLETTLNVSKNVNSEEVNRLKKLCLNSLQILKANKGDANHSDLTSIFNHAKVTSKKNAVKLNIQNIFDEEDDLSRIIVQKKAET